MHVSGKTYQRNESGAWVPTDDPESRANAMTNPGERIWCGVRSWTIWENQSYQRDTGDNLLFDVGERSSIRVQLELDASRRRFHTIRDEGTVPVIRGLVLDIFVLAEPEHEIGGDLKHWGPSRSEPERNDLLGTVIVRDEVMTRLLAALRRDERLSVGIGLKVYKEGIAHSFDEDWMSQDFFVDWEARTPIDFFGVQYSEHRVIAVPADSDEEIEARPGPAPPLPEAPPNEELVKRLNWIAGLLLLIAIVLVVRR